MSIKSSLISLQLKRAGIIEKNSIRWVSIDTLVYCMENNNISSKPLSLRGVFYKTIKKCIGDLIILKK
jgi:hypothetical protein